MVNWEGSTKWVTCGQKLCVLCLKRVQSNTQNVRSAQGEHILLNERIILKSASEMLLKQC